MTKSPTFKFAANPPADPVLMTTSGLVISNNNVVPIAAATFPIPDCNNATSLLLIFPS